MLRRVCIFAGMLAAGHTSAQSRSPLSFEVASVKAAAPCCAAGQWRESTAGADRIDFRYVTMRYCIAFAYRVKEFQISGPAWLTEQRYDIVAKAADGTKHDQLPEMVQSLLAERFKLQVHHETKEFNVFVIAQGKNGLKLKESPPAEPGAPEGANFGMSMSGTGVGRIEARRATMLSLANTLSRVLGRPVVDLTGLTGRYDFDLEYLREEMNGRMLPDAPGAPMPTSELGVSLFTSIQQLGLKLEAQKPPLDAIVVDRAEKVATSN